MSDRVSSLKQQIPQEALASLRVVMVVGTFVFHLVGPAMVAAALPPTIPIVVIEYIALAVEARETIEAIRQVLRMTPFFSKKGGDFEL
jgi:hypothetical protein